jgi:hypothetical protein
MPRSIRWLKAKWGGVFVGLNGKGRGRASGVETELHCRERALEGAGLRE